MDREKIERLFLKAFYNSLRADCWDDQQAYADCLALCRELNNAKAGAGAGAGAEE
ncbi:MAG: hypothetical protein [Podoviridae sp. cty5g4]|nr:MAG: hypothetical protein [Podoviridae sp. cty5g4]